MGDSIISGTANSELCSTHFTVTVVNLEERWSVYKSPCWGSTAGRSEECRVFVCVSKYLACGSVLLYVLSLYPALNMSLGQYFLQQRQSILDSDWLPAVINKTTDARATYQRSRNAINCLCVSCSSHACIVKKSRKVSRCLCSYW